MQTNTQIQNTSLLFSCSQCFSNEIELKKGKGKCCKKFKKGKRCKRCPMEC
jgi:hypothetical protein